jgi:penicillin-binding protein 1C
MAADPSPPRPPWSRRRRAAAALVAVCAVFTAWFVTTLQTTLVRPAPSTLVTDRQGRPLTEVPGGAAADRFGYWPLPWVLPLRLVVATLETEDRHFHEHPGVYLPSVARAVVQDVTNLRVVSGASTVAMQVARLQSGRGRGVVAKLQEMVEALTLVHRFGHDAVLRHYLTLAPYGARVHGAARAARFYFDKPVEDLSWLQAAWLAGLPQQPTRMGPFSADSRARGLARAHRILRTLHTRGYLDAHELDVALASDLGVVDRRPRPEDALHFAMRMAEDVRRARATRAPQEPLTHVRSTLDLDVQRMAVDVVRDNLRQVARLGAGNGSAIVVDVDSGDVVGWVGSADYFDAEAHGAIDYNRVKRSPGSTLKPFLYGLALDPAQRRATQRVWTAATPLADVPMNVVDDRGRSYVPRNIGASWLGPMSVREALGNSRNIPALRIVSEVGVPAALDLLQRGGVSDIDTTPGRYGLGLALGNLHVTAEELARLYLALAHHGVVRPLRFSSLDAAPAATSAPPAATANVATANAATTRLLDTEVADLITHILADDGARQPSFPVGSALEYDVAVAVKTGTSQGFRDGWTAAYTDRLLVVMWVGNHDWRRMNQLGGLAGTAEPTHALLERLLPTWKRHVPLPQAMPGPSSAERRVVCALSGQLAGPECTTTRSELFLPGTAPLDACPWHQRVGIDVRTGDLAHESCPAAVVQSRAVVDLPPAYDRWARQKRLVMKPHTVSRLCGGGSDGATQVALVEPEEGTRFVFDPDTPPEFATVRLAADVRGGSDEDVVFLVDDVPVARVGAPWEARWTLAPGRHVVRAVLARVGTVSPAVTIVVR